MEASDKDVSDGRVFVYSAEYSKIVQISSLDGGMKCKGWKKIRPLAAAGLGRSYRKFAGSVDLHRWSKHTLSPESLFIAFSLPLFPEGSLPGYLPE